MIGGYLSSHSNFDQFCVLEIASTGNPCHYMRAIHWSMFAYCYSNSQTTILGCKEIVAAKWCKTVGSEGLQSRFLKPKVRIFILPVELFIWNCGLNSIGDGHQPNSSGLMWFVCPTLGFPIQGGMIIPNIGSLDPGIYMKLPFDTDLFQLSPATKKIKRIYSSDLAFELEE